MWNLDYHPEQVDRLHTTVAPCLIVNYSDGAVFMDLVTRPKLPTINSL